MELTKKDKTIKYCAYAGLIALAALLQNVSGLWLELGNARCYFLIPVVVLLSIGEDEIPSALMGLGAGALWDLLSSTHYGFNSGFLMVFCYILAVLITHMIRNTYWVGVASSAIATLLYVLLYWLICVVSKGGTGAGATFWYFYLPSFIYTGVMAIPLNLIFIPLKRKLNRA